MLGRDGTGQRGMGPMTGKGFGFCGNKFYGRRNCHGMGFRGRGNGSETRYGFGSGYGMGYARQNLTEKGFLEKQKEFLKSQIDIIERELDNLDD